MNLGTRYDALVVGGGHNGLIAAIYLARAGQSVLLLERGADFGGATTSKRVFPGMDARLSRYAYLVSLLPRAMIGELGIGFTTRRRAIASYTPYEREGRADALLLSNVDEDRSRASVMALAGEREWRGYQQLLEIERVLTAMVWPSLLRPLRSRSQWEASLSNAAERAAWEAFVERPIGECIEAHLANDLLRGVVCTDGKIGLFTAADDPTLLQNRCFIMHVIGNGTGEWQVPIGGMGALVDGLVEQARSAGVVLLAEAEARAVSPGTPHHTVEFRLHDKDHAVDAARVLVNAGPQEFDRLLDRPHSDRPGDEGSVCKVNMLLRRLPRLKAASYDAREGFAGTFHINESYEQMRASYRQAAAGRLPDLPPAEIYCHTLSDGSILGPDLRQADFHTITLFGLDVPYRLFEHDHDARKADLVRRYLAGINQALDEPIEECLAVDAEGRPCIEARTPQDLEQDVGLNRGNIFHQALSWFFVDDPEQAGTWGVETEHERIYRCGSSALRGGAVSGIPGRNAAHCILRELGAGLPEL